MSFWKNKRVLITGHTGFKGGWLSLWLQILKAQVTGLSLAPSSTPNLFTLTGIENHINSCIGDLRDENWVKKMVHQCQPEIVFHLAAQPLVRYGYQHPITTYSTNIMGTAHLLEALRPIDTVKAIINVTSDKCYENKEWLWGYRETDRLGGSDPYSNSKACVELITAAYRDSYFANKQVGLATVRAGNVIGGGDWANERLVPDIMRAYFATQPLIIRHPHAIRPWQHVLEPLNGYLKLAKQLYHAPCQYADSWNFGPDEAGTKSVRWVTDYLLRHLNHYAVSYHEEPPQPPEATYLKLDCHKAKERLAWQPMWCLEKALDETLKWYQAYQSQEDMYAVTLSQIKNYIHASSTCEQLNQ